MKNTSTMSVGMAEDVEEDFYKEIQHKAQQVILTDKQKRICKRFIKITESKKLKDFDFDIETQYKNTIEQEILCKGAIGVRYGYFILFKNISELLSSIAIRENALEQYRIFHYLVLGLNDMVGRTAKEDNLKKQIDDCEQGLEALLANIL